MDEHCAGVCRATIFGTSACRDNILHLFFWQKAKPLHLDVAVFLDALTTLQPYNLTTLQLYNLTKRQKDKMAKRQNDKNGYGYGNDWDSGIISHKSATIYEISWCW